MMLVGASAAFAVSVSTGSLVLGIPRRQSAPAMLMALLVRRSDGEPADQPGGHRPCADVVWVGLERLHGPQVLRACRSLGIHALHVAGAPRLPVAGPLLFRFDPAVYGSILLYFVVDRVLTRTRIGLHLRAVGESPSIAHALGQPVMQTRYLAVLFGGAMSGIAGAYLSTAMTPMWVEGMSAGRGWIALALVVFATWKPLRVLLGAYLFGGVTILQLHAQGLGLSVPTEILSMLPYVATIVVLVVICRDPKTIRLNQPASLGKSFHPDV